MLRGARQVGKTFLVRDFAASERRALVEINFERDPAAARCFSDNDPAATVRRIEAFSGRPLPTDGSALLLLDEIQAADEVLPRLRWLAEELPRLPVLAAGSLLDFALEAPSRGVPVGRLGYLHLEPLGFEEFLDALGEDVLVATLRRDVSGGAIAHGRAVPEPIHARLLGLFRQYVLVGGMPAAVERYRVERSFVEVAALHDDLVATLRDDFGKYADRVHHRRLTAVLDAVPRQIGKPFRYSVVDRGERAAALGRAVDLLCLARVCHRVRRTAATGVPLAADEDARGYKLLLLDVGLVSSMLGVAAHDLENTDLALANEGALAEQLAGQLLRLGFPPHREPVLHTWRREERGSEAEVDYVVQHGTRVVPVEVKAGTTGSLKSLHLFMALRKLPTALRLNADRPSLTEVRADTQIGKRASYRLLSLPLYLVEQLHRLLDEIGNL